MRATVVFAVVAIVSALLIPLTPSEFWGVNYFCVAAAAFWGIMFAAQSIGQDRMARTTAPLRRIAQRTPPEAPAEPPDLEGAVPPTPFDPPPAPGQSG